MATRKKVTVETVEQDVVEQGGIANAVVEQGGIANAAEQPVQDAAGQPVENAAGQPDVQTEKKNARKALEVARNYAVKTVWCTADGIYWATSLEKRKKLPANRGEIEEYTFQ